MEKYNESNNILFSKVAKAIKRSLDYDSNVKDLLYLIEEEIGPILIDIIEDAIYNKKHTNSWN